jgi:hypothetical protein
LVREETALPQGEMADPALAEVEVEVAKVA